MIGLRAKNVGMEGTCESSGPCTAQLFMSAYHMPLCSTVIVEGMLDAEEVMTCMKRHGLSSVPVH